MHRRTDALLLIAIYEFVTAAILLLISCVVLPILLIVTPFVSESFGGFLFQLFWVGLALLATFGLGVASIVVGVGVLARREWARVGAMALAAPALLGFPLWTIAGILIIWYLAGDEARQQFEGNGWSGRFSFSTGHWERSTAAPADEPLAPIVPIGAELDESAPAAPPEPTAHEARTVEIISPAERPTDVTLTNLSQPDPAPPDVGTPGAGFSTAETLPGTPIIPKTPAASAEELSDQPADTTDRQPGDPRDTPEKPRPS